MGHLQPLNIFLRQEIDRMERVIVSVRSALIDLKLAIDGTIIMNEVIGLRFHRMATSKTLGYHDIFFSYCHKLFKMRCLFLSIPPILSTNVNLCCRNRRSCSICLIVLNDTFSVI